VGEKFMHDKKIGKKYMQGKKKHLHKAKRQKNREKNSCKAKNSKEIFVHGKKKLYTTWGQKKKFMQDKTFKPPPPSSLF